MFDENQPAVLQSKNILNGNDGALYQINAISKIPDNCNADQLEKLFKLKVGAKVIITVNGDIRDNKWPNRKGSRFWIFE